MSLHFKRNLLLLTLSLILIGSKGVAAQESNSQWYKGNLHTHSLWSDGNDFPEMIAAWYKDQGYHFLALSDHNVLSEGQRWMKAADIANRGGPDVIDKYLARFGDDWVETRGPVDTNDYMVRLKPLNEFRGLVEDEGEFLMIQCEEISDRSEGVPVHLNATNLRDLISPVGGQTVSEAIENNARAVKEQAERTGREIIIHLNHPNFGYAVTAEDIAHATSENFFEVYNGHPSINQLGDANHPSIEALWDIANTIRLGQLDASPLMGVGTDDSHHYHSDTGSISGRGWIMVRAKHLTPESLLRSMNAGDFYASTGVTLKDVQYDSTSKTISIEIDAEEGVSYTTEFIGTKVEYDDSSEARTDSEGNPIRSTRVYSADVGKVLATTQDLNPSYQLQGDELYVRAVIRSDKPHPKPVDKDQVEEAWTQPVGWRARLNADK